MAEREASPLSSWAEVCVLKPRLEYQARESGYLADWRALDREAKNGSDTLEAWQDLAARIAEHGNFYGSYAIRDDTDEETPTYGCPSACRCERRSVAGPAGVPPVCHLSGEPMRLLITNESD